MKKLLTILIFFIFTTSTSAQTIYESCDRSVRISDINQESLQNVRKFIEEEEVERIYLNSLGGQISYVIPLGYMIREYKIPVYSLDVCISACMMIVLTQEHSNLKNDGLMALHYPYIPQDVLLSWRNQLSYAEYNMKVSTYETEMEKIMMYWAGMSSINFNLVEMMKARFRGSDIKGMDQLMVLDKEVLQYVFGNSHERRFSWHDISKENLCSSQ